MTSAVQLGPETSACDKKEYLLLHPQSNTLKRLADLSAPLRESWRQKLSSPTPSYLTGAVVFFLNSYSINNFYCVLICRASSWPGLGSFRRRLLRSTCPRSCLRLFGWWSFWPHWIVRLHPSYISLDSTRHHLDCQTSPKLYQFGQHKTPSAKRGFAPGSNQKLVSCTVCEHQDKKFSSQS